MSKPRSEPISSSDKEGNTATRNHSSKSPSMTSLSAMPKSIASSYSKNFSHQLVLYQRLFFCVSWFWREYLQQITKGRLENHVHHFLQKSLDNCPSVFFRVAYLVTLPDFLASFLPILSHISWKQLVFSQVLRPSCHRNERTRCPDCHYLL